MSEETRDATGMRCPSCEASMALASWPDEGPSLGAARPTRCPSCGVALAVRTDPDSRIYLADIAPLLLEDAAARPLSSDLVPGAWYWITLSGLSLLVALLSFLDLAFTPGALGVFVAFAVLGLAVHALGEKRLAYRERRSFVAAAKSNRGVELVQKNADYRT